MLVVAAALYSAWLVGPLLNPALDPGASAASELAARGQPWAWLFRATDVLCGLLVVTVAIVQGRRLRFVWAGAAVFAVFTVADAVLAPLPCAASIDADCDGIPPGHLVTSLGAVAGTLISLAALIAVRGRIRWAAAALCGYLVVLVVADGGWAQRAELLGISAWLCLLAIELVAVEVQRHSRGREPT